MRGLRLVNAGAADDDAHLSAADTGGAFRLIANDTEAAELTGVWRFTKSWERVVSLALRRGDLTAIDTYDDGQMVALGK
ncbi:AAA family ATPase [Kribbella pratensis]|uniref:AAA family ATPase n=1 Tax=Kribbella pratensis TaxID=2512112 RepID=UPI001417072F|nr:AAA family ATPase [Kribbella pratensis]